MVLDGYNQSYGSGEVAEVSIDLIVTILVGLVGLGSLIGLVLLFVWLKKRLPRIG